MYTLARKFLNLIKFSNNTSKIDNEKQFDEEFNLLVKAVEEESTIASNKKAKCNGELLDASKGNINYKCIRTTGIITSFRENKGLIDNSFTFDGLTDNDSREELKEGYRVQFIGYREQDNDNIKVVKIEKILDNYWDSKENYDKNTNEENTEYFNTHQRNILGVVIDKNENFLYVDTDYNNITIDLDETPLQFLPQIGDNVCLNCSVQTDTSFIDTTGEILKVIGVYPARSKNIEGFITFVFNDWGVVENNSFFFFDILPNGYKPKQGDKVNVDLVENYKDNYIWRCTNLSVIQTSVTLTDVPQSIDKYKGELFLNKNGIVLSDNIKIKLKKLGDSSKFEIVVTNESNKVHKVLRSAFIGKKSESQIRLHEPRTTDSFLIEPNQSHKFLFSCKAKLYGSSVEIFKIYFEGNFSIGRRILIDVEVNTHSNNINGYSYRNSGFSAYNVWLNNKKTVVTGRAISNNKIRFIKVRLGAFEIPDKLMSIILTSHKSKLKEDLEENYEILKQILSPKNYVSKFQILLFIEEIAYFQAMRKYDRERAHFTRENEYLALEIENLAEQRPSLVLGDSIRATNPWAEDNKSQCFEGIIHKVLNDRILLKFNSVFQSKYNGEDYKLEFFYSRSKFKKQHYAIKNVYNNIKSEILFPNKIIMNNSTQLNVDLNDDGLLTVKEKDSSEKTYKWFNQNLNTIQKTAIKNILRGEARPMPYIIFGPPGTGKTMTLIETILQLISLVPNSRLIVGTPSNSAADLIATRLIGCEALQPGDFIRLVSHTQVEKELIPDHLKPYCATIDVAEDGTTKDNMIITDSGLKLKCQKKHLGSQRITIGTCITLGTLLQLGFPKGHFTHVILDEAGQCTEPESIISLIQIDINCGQIILAGDPQQLGPIVLSSFSKENGLESSLLCRLLTQVPYEKNNSKYPNSGGYNPHFVTKLIYNYRSLPSILKIYNDLFYESELIPKINEINSREVELLKTLDDILPSSNGTRSSNHGVFFIGVCGTNRQSSDSPSWFNLEEAKTVFLFLLKLYKKKINQNNIGIITPYHKQVQIIRDILIEAEVEIPKIGSVEEFQGQERDIILISTVRSQKCFVEDDMKYVLGFVQNSKRFNVAVSRSRALLVVFGNPYLLSLDHSWKNLIHYCINNGAYGGCNFSAK